MPRVAQFRAWKQTVFQNTNAASGRPDDLALVWVRQVDDPVVALEDLRKCEKKFRLLDKRLASSLQKIVNGELGREVFAATEMATQSGRSIGGREILRMIFVK